MRRWVTVGLGLLAAWWAWPLGAWADDRADDEDARLAALFRQYLDESFEAEPLLATRLGDHRFDDKLDDLSPEARDRNRERLRRYERELPARIRRRRLSRAGQIDYDILLHHLNREIWLLDHFDPYENDPRIYGEYLTESVYLLLTQSTLPREENVKHAIARMAEIPRIVEQARKQIGNPPRVKVETAILQTKGAIQFYTEGIFTLAGEAPGEGLLGERAQAAVAALRDYLEFLTKEIQPEATGEWRIGKRAFSQKLELELDAGLTAEEVVAEAQAEADRVEREMYVVARQMWGTTFPGQPLPVDDADGRRLTIQKVLGEIANDHSTAGSLAADARGCVAEIKQFITERKILKLPDPDRCKIIEMPEFMRGNSVAYYNASPPLDPKASGEYAISPPPAQWNAEKVESYLREYNRPMIKILTIHEAYPGHYVQLEHSNRCPSLIRKVLWSGTFAEGWAVYTEQMMLDQGFGHGDLALRMQQLKFYMRTVVNAILDYSMHSTTMTDDQARDLLTSRAFQTEGEAVYKIIRAKQTSCQLSTYFVGRTAFYRLRQAIEREQGEEFDLERFHEAVLGQGTLPVKYLPELVRQELKRPE